MSWVKGRVRKLRSFRKDTDNERLYGQQWVVDGEDGKQYLLSAHETWEVKVLPFKDKPGIVRMIEVVRKDV